MLGKVLLLEKAQVINDRGNNRDLRVYRRKSVWVGRGMVARCERLLNFVEKRYYAAHNQDSILATHYDTEVHILKEVEGVQGIPNMLAHSKMLPLGAQVIYMDYCGEPLSLSNCPRNWREQATKLGDALNDLGIYHGDINVRNICIRDGQLYLIDFGLISAIKPAQSFAESIQTILDDLALPKHRQKNTEILQRRLRRPRKGR
ncbi:unnamed protein product [marine sediment metagenome]|uniref:Uncharacterized protein n=1 Tax=marine sediment metagenome TaxID=412755 RepID=X0VGT6_9ZZZZ